MGVSGAVEALLPIWWTGVEGSNTSCFEDEAGVRGVTRAERSVRLWRGVSGNNADGGLEAAGRTGNGTAKS